MSSYYTSKEYYDFEMRSRDEVAFLYRQGDLYVVHNLTIGRYQIIRRTTNFLLVLAVIAVIVLILAIVTGSH